MTLGKLAQGRKPKESSLLPEPAALTRVFLLVSPAYCSRSELPSGLLPIRWELGFHLKRVFFRFLSRIVPYP